MSNPQIPGASLPSATFAVDPQEQRARSFLAAGKFRKARDECKLLCKRDRPRYLPLLIEANVGLIQEMLAKGQRAEAQQVVAYLKTIASAEQVRSVELQLAASSGDPIRSAPQAVALLAASGPSLTEMDRVRWADHIIVAFQPVTATSGPEAHIAEEVRAVHEALEAIAAGHHERALDAVRLLGRESCFRHWRLFVKGLVAFHTGESDKATRCFDGLPKESVPGRARLPYLLLLGATEVGRDRWPAPVVEMVSRLSGQAGEPPRDQSGWSRALTQAQTLWLGRRFVESYHALRDAVTGFPENGSGPRQAVSDFYFNAISCLPPEARDKYQAHFLAMEERGRTKNEVELNRILRTFCQLLSRSLHPADLRERWQRFIEGFERLHGANPRRASLAYSWLGECLGEAQPGYAFGDRTKVRLRDPAGAMQALRKSIELDAENLPACLKLCSVYATAKKTSDRNRLLDEMTRRFPDRKEVLVLAGGSCLDRKAYGKGLDYLERALQVDRLDPAVPDLFVTGLGLLARQCFRKGRLEDGRRAFARADTLLIEKPENFVRNPWCHLARRALLEDRYGDAAVGKELLEAARRQSPGPTVFRFFCQLASGSLGDRARLGSNFAHEQERALHAQPSATEAAALVRLWRFWRSAGEGPSLAQEERWLARYLGAVAQRPCPREAARSLLEALEGQHRFHGEARRFVQAALSNDRHDPLFRIYRWILDRADGLGASAADQTIVRQILQEATRRGDEAAAQLARRALAELDSTPGPPVEAMWESELDELDRPDERDEAAVDFPDGLPPLAPQEAIMMAGVMATLAGMSDREIAKAKKERPHDMPAEVFDLLVTVARAGVKLPGGPSPGAPFVPKQIDLL